MMGLVLLLVVGASADRAAAGGTPVVVLETERGMSLCGIEGDSTDGGSKLSPCMDVVDTWYETFAENLLTWAEPLPAMLKALPQFGTEVERAVGLRRRLVAEMLEARRLMKGRTARARLAGGCWPGARYVLDRRAYVGGRLIFFATEQSAFDATAVGEALVDVPSSSESRLCVMDAVTGRIRGYPRLWRSIRNVVAVPHGRHMLVEAPSGSWSILDGMKGSVEALDGAAMFLGVLNGQQTLLAGNKNELVAFDHLSGRHAVVAVLPPGLGVGGMSRMSGGVDLLASSASRRAIYLSGVVGGLDGQRRSVVVVVRLRDGSTPVIEVLALSGRSVMTILSGDESFVFAL